MASPRSRDEVRRQIETEREQLSEAVDSLRSGLDPRGRLPLLAAASAGAGFLAGGIGATVRFLARRSRES